MRQRTDVHSMPRSEVDSGLHSKTTMFKFVAVQHGFENNPNNTIMTR